MCVYINITRIGSFVYKTIQRTYMYVLTYRVMTGSPEFGLLDVRHRFDRSKQLQCYY